jgi:hypothetical protein
MEPAIGQRWRSQEVDQDWIIVEVREDIVRVQGATNNLVSQYLSKDQLQQAEFIKQHCIEMVSDTQFRLVDES